VTITLDIRPEIQAELARQAAVHGRALEAHAVSLLEEAVQPGHPSKPLSQSELDRTLQELAQFSHKIPLLPNEAFSRESLYRDHD
jgi:plasmid stability protein